MRCPACNSPTRPKDMYDLCKACIKKSYQADYYREYQHQDCREGETGVPSSPDDYHYSKYTKESWNLLDN